MTPLRKSSWLSDHITAWRTFALSNGLCSTLSRNVYWLPSGLSVTSLTPALRHDERHVHRRLAEGREHEARRLAEDDAEGLRIDDGQVLHEGEQLLAHRVLLGPAFERGHAILGRHRLAVVPEQTVTE